MTSSFGITPQRQVRDLVANPERPTAPAEPARPAGIPQQIGGQLLYAASYQPDNRLLLLLRVLKILLARRSLYKCKQYSV
jgi:hypothetical protein